MIKAGYISVPMASKVTVPDPETAAKAAQDMIVAIANPPGIGAVNEVIKSISLDAIPPLDIIFPAKIKSGMDSKISLFAASHASTTILLITPSPNAQ